MERFCDKCGTLVSGEGTFCPQCGAPMASAVDLSKPSSMSTVTPGIDTGLAPGEHPETDEYFTGSSENGASYNTVNTPMPSISRDTTNTASAPSPAPQQTYNSTPNPAPAQNTNYAQMPNYPQSANVNNTPSQEMTTGQWVGTILLGGMLGIVSLILLFVWAFGDTPQPKKNYARASLIIQAIVVGLYLLLLICMIACTGTIVGSEFWDEIAY